LVFRAECRTESLLKRMEKEGVASGNGRRSGIDGLSGSGTVQGMDRKGYEAEEKKVNALYTLELLMII